ncbi:hypothetical protein [Bradyrhizobium sp.]|uniref:hypothetical protein n=1 Tax=Bradyrhizobium sp. TaxID=376 RepID=UPI001D6F36E4|nr:hypothetical protein [Bradyrhizobium sp.]MBI5319270.1 hypothetical protein [Bradyrhizobium sp.]
MTEPLRPATDNDMGHTPGALKSKGFLAQCFVAAAATKQFSPATKPFSACGADIRKQRLVIKLPNKTAAMAGPGDSSMRTFSFILAFAFVLAGPSMAGSPDSLPAAGSFAYNGAPAANSAPVVLAAIK